MDSLYLLIPLSVLLAFGVLALIAWAVFSGQFDDVDGEGARILDVSDGGDGANGAPTRNNDLL